MALLMSVGILRIYRNRRWQTVQKIYGNTRHHTSFLSFEAMAPHSNRFINKRVISWELEGAYIDGLTYYKTG